MSTTTPIADARAGTADGKLVKAASSGTSSTGSKSEDPDTISRKAVLAVLNKRRDAIFDQNGDYEPDTNVTNLPGWAESVVEELDEVIAAIGALPMTEAGRVSIAHDGFVGDIIGHYRRRDGKAGVVVQQDGTNVVHVYGEKWLTPEAGGREGG